MFSVIFEVHPKAPRFDDYLGLAKMLKPILAGIDGFIDNERFESRDRPGWLLSHSTWRDEKSVVRWRTEGRHHDVQAEGRDAIFEDYHLRVGDVLTDTAPDPDAPVHELRFDATEAGAAKYAALTEITPTPDSTEAATAEVASTLVGELAAAGAVQHEVFSSIVTPGKLALLSAWRDVDAPARWRPSAGRSGAALRHRVVRVIRDYGMFDRRESPQFYPEAAKAEA